MSKKTLLFNSTYEVLAFIPERKAFKMLAKEKVEVISTWEDRVIFGAMVINHPSILRLKKYVRKVIRNYTNFSRKAVIKRDKSRCQYCQVLLSAAQITIDHVLPKSQGGITSFLNCVVCCKDCNSKKSSRTPEQADMVLLKTPMLPSFVSYNFVADPQEYWHEDWNIYLGI